MGYIFLVLSNVFGKCNWFNSLKPNLSKAPFSGNFLFFVFSPVMSLVVKSVALLSSCYL